MNKYDIKILSGTDNINISTENPTELFVEIGTKKEAVSVEKIDAVIIKTMDTGPIVEDMYAEVYVENTIYIILSELQNFKSIIFDVLNKKVALDMAKFIEASTHHFRKTFILFERIHGSIVFEDTEEKMIKLLEGAINAFCTTGKQDVLLYGFVLAIMSYCPLYMLVGNENGNESIVCLTELEGCPIPLYTSIQKCPKLPEVSIINIKKVSPKQYLGALLSKNTYSVVNSGSDDLFVLHLNHIQNTFASLISFHEEEAVPKENVIKKKFYGYEGFEEYLEAINNVENVVWKKIDCSNIPFERICSVKGVKQKIKFEQITLFEGYGISKPEELKIIDRWNKNKPELSMEVPIGIDEYGDIYKFNSKLNRDGASGLVSGVAGAGKTDLMTTWLLSMAINYHPKDVEFVIFDGTSEWLWARHLPHVIRYIGLGDEPKENISRVFNQIQSIYNTRIKLFEDNGTPTIDEHRLYKEKTNADEKEPYIFIIIDDINYLKNSGIVQEEIDNFLRLILSKGAKYKGIHTIMSSHSRRFLSDMMFLNLDFKWAMRTSQVSESKSIINGPEAANIHQPGETIIHTPNKNDKILAFFSEKRAVDNIKECELLAEHITNVANAYEVTPYSRMLTTPLGEKIYCNEVFCFYERYGKQLRIPYGIADDVEKNHQYIVEVNLSKKGNVAVFGQAKAGKTTFIETLLISIMNMYTVDDINVYIADFNSNDLVMFKNVPHVKIAATSEEFSEVERIFQTIEREAIMRSDYLSKHAVESFEEIRNKTDEQIPYCLLMIDGIDKMCEMDRELFDRFIKLLYDKEKLGIYVITTATKMLGHYKYNSLIGDVVALSLESESDYRCIGFDVRKIRPKNIKGRGLIVKNNDETAKSRSIMEVQTVLPIDNEPGVDNSNIAERIKEKISYFEKQ